MDSEQLQLLAEPLLVPLPGESLFSLCSRHHALWGHPTSRPTSVALFGGARSGTQHDLPSHLESLARRTDGQWGDAATLATHRTLLRFYAPFLEERVHDHAVASMRGHSVAHLKFRLGLLTSRFRANHPLKACQQCLGEDRRQHGWTYWHLEHQYPGVWVCPCHGTPLLESQLKSTGVERFQWHLPDEAALRQTPSWPPAKVTEELRALASFVCAIAHSGRPTGWMRDPRIEELCTAQFDVRDWFTQTGRLRVGTAARDFWGYCSCLQGPDELRAFPTSLSAAKAQVGRLRRSLLEGTHPLRLIVALHWIFGDFDHFVRELDSYMGPLERQSVTKRLSQPMSKYIDGVRNAVVNEMRAGQSARAAASIAGVAVATAMVWAAAAGIAIARRPKILSETTLGGVKASLAQGDEKADVAHRYGLSVETVTRVLRSEIGLHGLWRQARWAQAQDRARSNWQCLVRGHPEVGVKLLRAMDPSAYAWLYRHDRTWLKANCPQRQAPAPANRRSSVDWIERDHVLKKGVERAVLELSRIRPGRRLRLWEIYQVFPDLKPKLRQLYRLPLTRLTLERALGKAMSGKEEGSLFG